MQNQKHMWQEKNKDKMDFITIKNFWAPKDTINDMKR